MASFLKKKGAIVTLNLENSILHSVYNKVVCPTNFNINWSDFFLLSEINEWKDVDILQDMIVYLRSVLSEFQRCKIEKMDELYGNPVKKKNKNDENKGRRGFKNVKYNEENE